MTKASDYSSATAVQLVAGYSHPQFSQKGETPVSKPFYLGRRPSGLTVAGHCLSLAAAALVSLTTTNTLYAQSLSLPATASLGMGSGYDAPSGMPLLNKCLQVEAETPSPVPTTNFGVVTVLTNKTDLTNTEGVTVNASYSGLSASSSVAYKALVSGSDSLYSDVVRAKVVVQRGSRSAKIKPLKEYRKLYNDKYLEFLQKCGTHFVSGWTLGGSFEFSHYVSGRTVKEQTEIQSAAALAVQSGQLNASKFTQLGSLTGKYESKLEHTIIGAVAVPTTKTLEAELTFANTFEGAIDSLANKVPMEYQLTSYEQVYGPPAFKAEYGKLLGRFVELYRYSNALLYITQHPNQFAPYSPNRMNTALQNATIERATVTLALKRCQDSPSQACVAPAELVKVRLPERWVRTDMNPQVPQHQACSTLDGQTKVLQFGGHYFADPPNKGASTHFACDSQTPCLPEPAASARNLGGNLWLLSPNSTFLVSLVDGALNDNERGPEGFYSDCGEPLFLEDFM